MDFHTLFDALRRLFDGCAVRNQRLLHGAEAILLEALEIVLGQPTGSHTKYFPFKSLPTHCSEDFERTASCARKGPADALSKLTPLRANYRDDIIYSILYCITLYCIVSYRIVSYRIVLYKLFILLRYII